MNRIYSEYSRTKKLSKFSQKASRTCSRAIQRDASRASAPAPNTLTLTLSLLRAHTASLSVAYAYPRLLISTYFPPLYVPPHFYSCSYCQSSDCRRAANMLLQIARIARQDRMGRRPGWEGMEDKVKLKA